MGTLRSEALKHGEQAWGAKYVVRGFTRSLETDLLFGLGFPHLRRLDDDHPDNALSPEEFKPKLSSMSGPDIPTRHAARAVRAMGVLVLNPDASWRQPAHEAFEDDSPFSAESAAVFVKDHLRKSVDFGFQQLDVAFTLEALVGADVIATAAIEAFEGMSDAELVADVRQQVGWAVAVGIMLLRTSKTIGDALHARVQKLIARGRASGPAFAASIVQGLDAHVNGHRAGGQPRYYTTQLTWWSEAPKQALLDALVKAEPEINKWSFSVEPRLAMLGGDAVIDLYRRKWSVLKDAEAQTRLVEWFGEIAHPAIEPLIKEMAEKSKAKKAARAWLSAVGAAAALAPAPAKAVEKKPTSKKRKAPVQSSLPLLDADVITAKLDAAVASNNWPDFFELNPEDVLHGMRLVAARAGNQWGLAIERLQGDSADSLVTRTWLFGSADPGKASYYDDQPVSFSFEDGVATGPQGELQLEDQTDATFVALVRAYHAHFDGGLWPDAMATARLLGLGENPQLVVVSDAFAHVRLTPKKKQALPSQSKTYQSLASALAAADGSMFKPGKSNV
jgi:hypothetical protein